MAGTLNKFQAIGNFGRDPEIKEISDNNYIFQGSIATTSYWYEESERKERTDWHNIVAFGKKADVCMALELKKGHQVYVEGEMRTRSWEGDDGVTRYKTECHLQTIQKLTGKGAPNPMHVASSEEDDIPYELTEKDYVSTDRRKEFFDKLKKDHPDTEKEEPKPVGKGGSETTDQSDTHGDDWV